MTPDGESTYVAINEDKEAINLVVWKDGLSKSTSLTPDEARHIASRLRVAANRVERGDTL